MCRLLEIRDASSSREIQQTTSGGQMRAGDDVQDTVEILRDKKPDEQQRGGICTNSMLVPGKKEDSCSEDLDGG
ncbi:hypothetical protein L5515_001347 [Caenorhabditis briggsae]|uniref:Uncharacterized protein n=1 Tax=Caenorhabditis briggsae TaxID=6238 RepID=A0AAE9E2Q0_CAEBR|nr:hypothetical protein L3Y34_015270 [Caenorhabditis briggsae]UMM12703.1 hypothetical protein L5515_001347 [Caenorhabditis briggsae]